MATKLCRDCSLHNADSKASDKQMYTPYFVSLVNLYLRFFIINFSFVVPSVSLSLSHWYPGSGVVLDCIDS